MAAADYRNVVAARIDCQLKGQHQSIGEKIPYFPEQLEAELASLSRERFQLQLASNGLKQENCLSRLFPQCGVVTSEPLKGAVVQISEPQETESQRSC